MIEHFRLLGKHTFLYSIGHGFLQLGSFLLLPLLARYLTVDQFGIMAILLVFGAIVREIAELGILTAITRIYFDFKNEKNKKEVLGTSFVMLHLTGILIVLIFLPISKIISNIVLGSPQFSYLFTLLILSLYFDSIFNFHLSVLRVKNCSLQFVFQSLFKLLIFVLITVYFVVSLERGLEGVFEAGLLSSLISFIMSHCFLLRKLSIAFNRDMAREIMQFGLPFVPTRILSLILTSSDRYLLGLFSSINQVGLYTMGYKIGMFVNVFVIIPFNLAWPQQIKPVSESRNADEIFSKILTFYFVIAGFVVTTIVVFLDEIYTMFLTSEFSESKIIVIIIAISYLINGTYNILLVGPFLYKKTMYQPIIYGVAAVLNVGLNLYFIPKYGIYGAAGTTLFCCSLIPVLTYLFSRKYYRFNIEYSRIAKIIICLIIIYLFGRAISYDNLVLTVFVKACILVLFPLFLYMISFCDEKEKIFAKKMFNRLVCKYYPI